MKIYLDYIFFENFIVNYFILNQLPIFCKISKNKIRMLISSIILAIYSTIIQTLDIYLIENYSIRLIIIFINIYISFKPNNLVKYLKYFSCYLLFYYIYIGINIFIILFFNINISNFYIKLLTYLISYFILTIVNRLMWKMWKNNIKNKIIYKLLIDDLEINVFVDTGNNVKDRKNNLDVFFLSDEFKTILLKNGSYKQTKININTATASDEMDGYIFNNIILSTENSKIYFKKAVIIFISNKLFLGKKYSGLISYDTYIEKLEGATL